MGSYAKELSIRKRIAGIYNKLEDEFASLREYNDFLEHVEDIVFRLVEGVDVAATEAEVKAYEAAHREQIVLSRARRAEQRAAEARAAALPPHPGETSVHTLLQQMAQQESAGPAGADEAPLVALPAVRPPGLQPAPVLAHHHVDAATAFQSLTPEEREGRRRRGLRAGGWSEAFAVRRALEEAFGSLWVQ